MADSHDRETGINKSRYWNGILYTENMVDNWRELLPDYFQIPCAYCVHGEDVDEQGEERKEHVHVLGAFGNTTTKKHAKEVFNTLSKPGKICCSTAQAAISVRHSWNYLIHDTEGSRKAGKHLYDVSDRVEVNGFDIGFYEQVSAKEKHEMVYELSGVVIDRQVTTLSEFFCIVRAEYDFRHFESLLANNAYFDRLCRGVYLQGESKKSKNDRAIENMDASRIALAEIIARNADGERIAVCEECGQIGTVENFASYGGEDGVNIGVCMECAKK